MSITVFTARLRDEAQKLRDVYYQSMVRWRREKRDRDDPLVNDENVRDLKRSAETYLEALGNYRNHLSSVTNGSYVAVQLKLTETFIELVERNKRIYDDVPAEMVINGSADGNYNGAKNNVGITSLEPGRVRRI